jgi:ankyrin repeat protein
MNKRGNDVESAAEGTCTWLFQHPKYQDWISRPRGLLWIKGKPGAGKSTLLKHTLKNSHQIEPTIRNKGLVISFFFHGRGTELQKTPLGLFRSFLHQLLSYAPSTAADLVQTFKEKRKTIGVPGKEWNWHPRELQDFFEASLPKVLEMCSVFILVDALDECGKEAAVMLVEHFQDLVQKLPPTGSQLSICFTCRHYPILALDCGSEIWVDRENEQDIATYIREQLTRDGRTRSHIADTIISRASSSFQWASLVIKHVLELERDGKGTKIITGTIERIPQGLNDLYKDLFESIPQEERPDSLKLMQWICFAVRPLTLDELRFAMVIDPDCPYKSLQTCQSSDEYIEDNEVMERSITTLSRGLVETRAFGDERIVQFIHQSVNDFFIQDGIRLLAASWESNDLAIGGAHYRLSRSCIRYLGMEETAQYGIEKERVEDSMGKDEIKSKFPLLHYAATCWLVHTVRAESKGTSQADLLCYLDWPSKDLWRQWIRIYQLIDRYSNDCPSHGTTPLHIASRYSLMSLLFEILKDLNNMDVKANSKDIYDGSSLPWAAEGRHEAVVKLLVERDDVGADSKDENGRTPLSWATEKGHEAVVKALLNTGKVDVDSKDENGWTPLSWAAENGHEAMVKALLATGKVDVESKDKYGRTPLSWAAVRGHEAVVKALLATGKVDDDLKDTQYAQTPLLRAAKNGHEAVVKALIATGKVDVDSEDTRYGRTPLSWAAEKGHEAVVRALLATEKVDVDSKDTRHGRTPLSWTAGKGHKAMVRALLATGKVDIDSKDKYGWTPLQWAAENGHEAVVEALLATGKVDVESKDK